MPTRKEYTAEEIERKLINAYGEIPRGSLKAYAWLRSQTGLDDDPDLPYKERLERHKNICKILEVPLEGGLAGRDVNEF